MSLKRCRNITTPLARQSSVLAISEDRRGGEIVDPFLGEVALISGEPRNATVVAQNAVDTFVLGKADFEAALSASQSFRDQLYRIYFIRH